ncbi:442_t:CDS:2 [Funneliformis geosporum]|nr:442_t:CDS:2 [Funneliformis geosporum]
MSHVFRLSSPPPKKERCQMSHEFRTSFPTGFSIKSILNDEQVYGNRKESLMSKFIKNYGGITCDI